MIKLINCFTFACQAKIRRSMNMLKLKELSVEKHVIVWVMLLKRMVTDIGATPQLGLITKSQLKVIAQLFRLHTKLSWMLTLLH